MHGLKRMAVTRFMRQNAAIWPNPGTGYIWEISEIAGMQFKRRKSVMLKQRAANFAAGLVTRHEPSLLARLLIQCGAAHHFINPLLAGDVSLGIVYPKDMLELLAVGKLTEVLPRCAIDKQRLF